MPAKTILSGFVLSNQSSSSAVVSKNPEFAEYLRKNLKLLKQKTVG